MSDTGLPEKRARSLWESLKGDPTFRATFLAVFVVPAVLMVGTIGWIVRAMILR